MIFIPNNKIAVEPIKSLSVEITGRERGFAIAKQKNELLALRVVYPPLCAEGSENEAYLPGGTVYIRGDYTSQQPLHEKFMLDGVEVSLLPLSAIQAYLPPVNNNSQALTFGY